MVFTGCSASGNGALPDNKKNDPAAAEIAERTMQLSASAEAESEIDRQLLPYLDKAFYGAILKAIGEDQTVNYMISDIDGDGAQELAVTSYFDGNTANSCMLFKNALDYYMYYDPGIYGGDIWHKFRYDRNTDSLLWAVGSIAKDDTCSRYYSLSGGRWTMNSIMSGDANENSDKEGILPNVNKAFDEMKRILTEKSGQSEAQLLSETGKFLSDLTKRNYQMYSTNTEIDADDPWTALNNRDSAVSAQEANNAFFALQEEVSKFAQYYVRGARPNSIEEAKTVVTDGFHLNRRDRNRSIASAAR